MKIYTITCHDVYNYGASLQAYALQHYLESKGHEVTIIDYLPSYMDKAYKIKWNSYELPLASKFYKYKYRIPCLEFLYKSWLCIKQICFILKKWKRKVAFDDFKKSFLKTTNRHFRTYDELVGANFEANAFIAGSDQIWNTAFHNGLDPSFYLEFAKGKRIAYAASFGLSELDDSDKPKIRQYLSGISNISVREKTGLGILKDLGYVGTQVLDPVFLLERRQWFKICTNKYCFKSFVLVYNLGPLNENIRKCAVKIAKENKLKIVSIEEIGSMSYADTRITNAGPSEFLELFSKASFVVTNSFHATAFSLLFNVPFYCFIKNKTASRIKDVLDKFELTDRLNPNVDIYDSKLNWNTVNKKIADGRKNAISFLLNALTM